MMAAQVFAAAEPLDCQTSSTFEQNLDELSEVTSKVEGDCPAPTKDDLTGICSRIWKQEKSELQNLNFKYQEDLWKMSCADPAKDSIEVAKDKVQKMWIKHRESFRCYNYPTSVATDKNITKFAMDTSFSVFLLDSVKRYKLDMNFKDPADQKTIMDFIVEKKQFIQNSPPVDNAKVAEYERIYKLLEINGAKHAKDL